MVQQIAIYDQGCERMVGVSLSHPDKLINLSRQNTG